MFEELNGYESLILDYSVMREYGGTQVFSELIDRITKNSMDVYVSKTFKLMHYCVINQGDPKDVPSTGSMKTFCSYLLPQHKLHLVQATSVEDFLGSLTGIPNRIILTTRNGVFTKRLYEKRPVFDSAVMVLGKKGTRLFPSIISMVDEYPMPKISELASQNKFLDTQVICSVGDVVRTEDGNTYELSNRMSGGAEGMVFLTNKRNQVAKIYHRNVITPLRWAKLKKICELGITSSGFCLPQHLIYLKEIPVGYMMPLGKGNALGNVFDGPDAILEAYPKWKRIDVVTTLLSLIEKYLYLHMHNCVAGDIQLKNALIYAPNAVYLIDMDSIQIANLPCPVGTEEFTDPRLWGRNFAGFIRGLEDEDYSIAMLVFSILFCGLHPYATRNGAETLREEIINHNFPYTMDNSSDEHIPRGGYQYIWEYLPERIRTMLYNTFKLGKSYETVEWYDAVTEYKDALLNMRYEDPEAYKVFPKMDYNQAETVVKKPEHSENKPGQPAKPVKPMPTYIRPEVTAAPKGKYVPKNNNPVTAKPAEEVGKKEKKGLLGLFGKKSED